MLTATSGLNHTLSQPLMPLEKVSERRVSVVPAGDGSAGVVATSVDIFAVLGAKGLIILPTPTGQGHRFVEEHIEHVQTGN